MSEAASVHEVPGDDEESALTQKKYIVQELRLRGWLHMKGSQSLPTPREGQMAPEDHGDEWEKTNSCLRRNVEF